VREKRISAGEYVSALKLAAERTRTQTLQMQNQ
jgi:hypothetical protein